MRISAVLAALLMANAVADAATVEIAGATRCTMSGWSKDKDPAGLDVRAGPRADAPVIAKLPPVRKGDDYPAVEFRIIGSRDGWLLIEKAKIVDYDGGTADRAVFAGPGWVSGSMVGFEINDTHLRAAPSDDSPIKADLFNDSDPKGSYTPDSATVDQVYGCDGAFADVLIHMPNGPEIRGWATRICSNQVTTCV